MNRSTRDTARLMTTPSSTCWTGFTLIELLIVISVIGLLVGLVLPSLNRALRSARQVACLTNQREFGRALVIYVDNHNGLLPRRGQGVNSLVTINRAEDWFNALPPLLGQRAYSDLVSRGSIPRPGSGGVWMCPEAIEISYPYYIGYGMNMCLSTWNTVKADHINKVGEASSMVFLGDSSGMHCSLFPSAKPYSPNPRHDGKVVLSFVDGHGSVFTGNYVGCGVGDPQHPDVRWVVPDNVWKGPPP